MLRVWRSALLLLSVVVSGCGSYCAPDRNIRDRIDESALLGTWRLTDQSLKVLAEDTFRRDPSHRYTITFHANRTCAFASVAQFLDISYLDTPCTWRLEHDVEGSSRPQANLVRIDLPHEGNPFSLSLSVGREDGVLILWEFYKDPDLWDFLEYRK